MSAPFGVERLRVMYVGGKLTFGSLGKESFVIY